MTHELTPHPCKVKKQMTMERKEMTNQDLPEPDWDDMEDEFKFLFAEKNGRTLCLKYNAAWELSTFDYLIDKGYQLRHSSEAHWNRQHDEVGRPVEAYLLDDDLKEFDIGIW